MRPISSAMAAVHYYFPYFLLVSIIALVSLYLGFISGPPMECLPSYWSSGANITSKWSSAFDTTCERSSDECNCVDNTTGESFNFCYHLPWNESIRGRRFSCEWLPILRELDLLGHSDRYITNLSQLFSGPNSVVFVTAASQNHFAEELALIKNVQDLFPPQQRIIFYGLGLSSYSQKLIRNLCNVEYRRFPFEKYPKWTRNLFEYRWKSLLIAEALKEFGVIWYMDSSIRFKTNNLSIVYSLFSCGTKDPVNSDRFHTSTIQSQGEECGKFTYLLHGNTGHGPFPVTHPGMYNFIPTDLQKLKDPKCPMFEANIMFAIRTREVVEHVLKWYVLCSLERDCIAPPASALSCSWDQSDRYGVYAKCHRFDQSAMTLLLANLHQFHCRYWTTDLRFHEVGRGVYLSGAEQAKLKVC